MPSVPFSTLAVVVRNFQLMCGMPRTSTMPRMPAASTMTSTAEAQTSAFITQFQVRREGEKHCYSSRFPPFSTTLSRILMPMIKTNSTSAMLNSACFCRPLA